MSTVEDLKLRLKSLRTEKKQLNNELKNLRVKLDLKLNQDKQSQQETNPQLKEIVAFK